MLVCTVTCVSRAHQAPCSRDRNSKHERTLYRASRLQLDGRGAAGAGIEALLFSWHPAEKPRRNRGTSRICAAATAADGGMNGPPAGNAVMEGAFVRNQLQMLQVNCHAK
jgi:hypothetical protein